MLERLKDRVRGRLLKLVILAYALMALPTAVDADSFQDARVRSGVRLFRIILKADLDIESKKAADGSLAVLMVGGDGATARLGELSRELQAASGVVAGAKIVVKPVAAAAVAAQAGKVAAVFVAEPLPEDVVRVLVKFGEERHIISFSPIEGDVERGVLCGISFEAKVVPFINMKTMKASGVELSPLVMKLGKPHE